MNRNRAKAILGLVAMAFVAYLAVSACANKGMGPQGGPKDINPPLPLKSTPNPNALHYNKNRIEIIFDEIIQVDKAFENVIVSPPQKQTPVIKAIGKKLIVELQDSLIDNTTYTIFFGNAIVDNNEKNPLSNYLFAFSTGSTIDTLTMSGTLIDAHSLNPLPGIVIGIHSNLSDTAFTRQTFERITKTDENGNFTVSNIKAGSYRIYALDDIGNNYKFDQPNELIAFLDTVYIPTAEQLIIPDTIYNDSLKQIDTVINRSKTIFTPDSIVLKAFVEENNMQYLVKSERPDRQHFTLYFNNINEHLPQIEGFNFVFDENDIFIQANQRQDTISYWLKDSNIWHIDTLQVGITYQKNDSNGNIVSHTDTLLMKAPKTRQSSRQRNPKTQVEHLPITSNARSDFNYFDPIEIVFKTPTTIKPNRQIAFEIKVDTLWRQQPATIEPVDSLGMRYRINTALKESQTYRLTIDSAYFSDIYGKTNNTHTAVLTCKNIDQYASITIEMGLFTGKEIVELLDKDERVIRTLKADKSKITFDNLDAGTYYARLFIDINGNGRWDTGKFTEKRQAEPVYYYPYSFSLRKMWDSEEYWHYTEFPIIEQKPKELKHAVRNSN